METQPATAIQARIIVVNDDVTQLRIFVGLLSKHGYTTEGFSEVTTALERMEAEGAPDLIITDLYMPGIDGWRFCRLLRSPEYAALNQTPILVNSATFTGRDAEKITAELGANAFLPSPVRGAELLQRVQQLLTRRAPLPLPRVLIVEDDPDIASVLESIYRVHGYHADAVASGSAARGKFAAIPYDLAVIDYHLPDLLGDCLLREFQVLRPDAVYIMTTGDMQPRLAVEWMKLGASAYVHKPFDPDYLYAVSENARRERALLRIPALLEDRTQELRKSEALLAQAQKMDSIGRLAGGVAHDFNNMLGVILGHAEMALAEVDPAAQLHDHLVEIQKAAMRSADLTRQLLAFARRQTVLAAGDRPERNRERDAEDAQAVDRRKHRTGLAAGGCALADQNRSCPGRPDPGQPVRQRARRHPRCRPDHDRDSQCSFGRSGLHPLRRRATRALRDAGGPGYRVRHDAGSARPHLRAVLYHQGTGRGDRAGTGHRLRGRPAERGIHHRGERTRRGINLPDLPGAA